MGGTPDVVGKVVRSSNATVEGSTLLSNGTILSGDAVNVGEGGSVLLSYSPTGRAVLSPATHVRFSKAKGNIVAQLLSGTLAVERENKDVFVVKTSTYRVEPQGEGKAEFLVALLPDQRTIVEAQHGKVAITETSSGESYTLTEGLRAEISASQKESPGQGKKEETSPAIGQVIASAVATRNGKPLAVGDWVVDENFIATGAAGHAVIRLWPTNQVTLNENTSVILTRPVERVWLRLQNGTILAENTGESNLLIATTRFHIEPTSPTPSMIRVGVMTDNSTAIESVAGDVKIEDMQSGQLYLLPAGQRTQVPANASGVPGLQPLAAAPAPTPTPSTPPSQQQPSSAPGRTSHNTLLIVAIGVGAGIAAAVAGLAGGGHGSGGGQPVSPSAP
jgi:ferric-dicitrate binding protein FerR (iron transport regulator)